MLAHGGARPYRLGRGFTSPSDERPRAARRLLQPNRSASTIVDDPNPAHRTGSRPPSQLFSRVATAEAQPFGTLRTRPTERHGSRDRAWTISRLLTRYLSTRSLAKRALPRPTWLGHLTLRTRCGSGLELSRRRSAPVTGARCELAMTKAPLSASSGRTNNKVIPSVRVAPNSAPRRDEPGAVARGAFRRRSTLGRAVASTTCPQAVDYAGAFSILANLAP
jgi:hypothetical protein